MILLGVILLLLGAAIGVVSVVAARSVGSTVHVEAFGLQRDAAALELFVVGVLAALVFCLGWALIAAAVRARSRRRRDERERERVAEVERTAQADRAELERSAEADRVEHERRLEDAKLRDEDLRRREDDLATRARNLDAREQEVGRLEAAYREQVPPSVADVVTGRAHGRVSEGTAEWEDRPVERRPDENRGDERP